MARHPSAARGRIAPSSPALRCAAARARTGRWAEELVARRLSAAGWTIVARNLRVGRAELDIVALDPKAPGTLVVVEVRAGRGSRFGPPEATVDRAKLRTVYRGALALLASDGLPRSGVGAALPPPSRRLRVDLVAVEAGPTLARDAPGDAVRHLRGIVG